MDKEFSRDMFLGMVAYVVVLFASIAYIKDHMDLPARFLIAVLPMIPLVFVARASVRRLTRLDELQKQIQYTALAITVLATALITLTYGFLENVGLPHVNVLWVWPLMGATWGTASCIAARCYQ
jgi:hypothetical protein